jgi:ribosomal protein S18 acetylase RimI-like enzyme
MTRATGSASKSGEGLPLLPVDLSDSGPDFAGSDLESESIGQHVVDDDASVGRGSQTGAGRRIVVRELGRAEFWPAAELAARGMIDDPILIRVFGLSSKKRLRRLTHYYANGLRYIHAHGELLGAFARGELVGVIGSMRPGCCQPGPVEALRIVPMMVRHTSPFISLRLKLWVDAWARHDPREDHWHIGLLAVEPRVQGLGVGTKLMAEHCARRDEAGTVSYLETDRANNVRFYEKFGYCVAGQAQALGVRSWFMRRAAGGERF